MSKGSHVEEEGGEGTGLEGGADSSQGQQACGGGSGRLTRDLEKDGAGAFAGTGEKSLEDQGWHLDGR